MNIINLQAIKTKQDVLMEAVVSDIKRCFLNHNLSIHVS